MKKSYSELLKDPRWQKKKTEILKRDKFTCRLCKDTETTLHVHHKEYINGNAPWDYPNDLLITLCEHCHSVLYNSDKVIDDKLIGSFCKDNDNNYIKIYSRNKRIAIHYYVNNEFRQSFLVNIDNLKSALKLHFNE